MTLASQLLAELDDTDLDHLAELLAPRLAGCIATVPARPWLNTEEAARYLATSRGRVHDLVQLRKLEPRRDGRRLLFRRDDLDAYLEASA